MSSPIEQIRVSSHLASASRSHPHMISVAVSLTRLPRTLSEFPSTTQPLSHSFIASVTFCRNSSSGVVFHPGNQHSGSREMTGISRKSASQAPSVVQVYEVDNKTRFTSHRQQLGRCGQLTFPQPRAPSSFQATESQK